MESLLMEEIYNLMYECRSSLLKLQYHELLCVFLRGTSVRILTFLLRTDSDVLLEFQTFQLLSWSHSYVNFNVGGII